MLLSNEERQWQAWPWLNHHCKALQWRWRIKQQLAECRTDTVRAKVAAGLFDRIANWNGYGRALYPSSVGMQATGKSSSITTSAGLQTYHCMTTYKVPIFPSLKKSKLSGDLCRRFIVESNPSEDGISVQALCPKPVCWRFLQECLADQANNLRSRTSTGPSSFARDQSKRL